MEENERLIFGEQHSTLALRFRSKATDKEYEVVVKRHVPIQGLSWSEQQSRYKVKEELEGQLLCTSTVRAPLQKARIVVLGLPALSSAIDAHFMGHGRKLWIAWRKFACLS